MEKPIFIVGANRSGTTLLRLILNSHSQVAVPDELVYFRGAMFHRAPTHWKVNTLSPEHYEIFVRDFLDRNREELGPLDLEQLAREIVARGVTEGQAPDMRLPYKHALESWARHYGKVRWGEKTPGNIFYAAEIREMFPDSKFVCMVRDPRAGVLSMQKASFYSTDPVINALNRLHFMTEGLKIMEAAIPAEDRTIIRYEDLLADPETTTRNLCSFLDLDFEPEMFRYYEKADQYMKAAAATDINAAAKQPILQKKAESWRSGMNTKDVATVEAIFGDTMQTFSYDVEGELPSLPTRASIWVRQHYWKYHMWRNRQVPDYQVMHGFLPRFRKRAGAGQSLSSQR